MIIIFLGLLQLLAVYSSCFDSILANETIVKIPWQNRMVLNLSDPIYPSSQTPTPICLEGSGCYSSSYDPIKFVFKAEETAVCILSAPADAGYFTIISGDCDIQYGRVTYLQDNDNTRGVVSAFKGDEFILTTTGVYSPNRILNIDCLVDFCLSEDYLVDRFNVIQVSPEENTTSLTGRHVFTDQEAIKASFIHFYPKCELKTDTNGLEVWISPVIPFTISGLGERGGDCKVQLEGSFYNFRMMQPDECVSIYEPLRNISVFPLTCSQPSYNSQLSVRVLPNSTNSSTVNEFFIYSTWAFDFARAPFTLFNLTVSCTPFENFDECDNSTFTVQERNIFSEGEPSGFFSSECPAIKSYDETTQISFTSDKHATCSIYSGGRYSQFFLRDCGDSEAFSCWEDERDANIRFPIEPSHHYEFTMSSNFIATPSPFVSSYDTEMICLENKTFIEPGECVYYFKARINH